MSSAYKHFDAPAGLRLLIDRLQEYIGLVGGSKRGYDAYTVNENVRFPILDHQKTCMILVTRQLLSYDTHIR